MALTLPNNLVFVPLDVLTAEELNQLMANDTFLANLFPLASSNIDWSTIKPGASDYLDLGPIRIQWGNATGVTLKTTKTVPLPAAFGNSNYALVVTPQFNETGNSFWFAFVTSKAAASFGVRGGFYNGDYNGIDQSTNLSVDYIAIGAKPNS